MSSGERKGFLTESMAAILTSGETQERIAPKSSMRPMRTLATGSRARCRPSGVSLAEDNAMSTSTRKRKA